MIRRRRYEEEYGDVDGEEEEEDVYIVDRRVEEY